MEIDKSELLYLCISDDEPCEAGYKGYIFPDQGYEKNIDSCKSRGIPYEVIGDVWWKNDEDVFNDAESIKKIMYGFFDDFTPLFNVFLSVDYSPEEWNVLLGAWAFPYLSQLYDKYRRITYIVQNYNALYCEIYDTCDCCPAYDYTDWNNKIRSDESFQKYQYSEIISFLRNKSQFRRVICKENGVMREPDSKPTYSRFVGLRNGIYDFVFRAIHFLSGRRDKLVIRSSGLPDRELIKFSIKHFGHITNYAYIERVTLERLQHIRNDEFRNRARLQATQLERKNFEECAAFLIWCDIPYAYLENFPAIRKASDVIFRYAKRAQAVVYSASSVFSDEIFKAYLMDIKRKGEAKLYVVQHGGIYGIDKSSYNDWEACISDYQLTWGWRKSYNGVEKCIPMPAARLVSVKETYKANDKSQEILFVDYTQPKHLTYFMKQQVRYSYNQDEKLDFLGKLGTLFGDELTVRLYPNSYGRNVKESYLNILPNLNIDNNQNVYESMVNAKLCISADFVTTVLEMLLLGRPCVCFREKGNLEENAISAISELEKAGIVYNSWDEMYEGVTAIMGRVEDWWNEPSRQKAVQDFCHEFVYVPDDAVNIWKDKLISLM